ncbi:hypothetical protein CDO28_22495 (plasmid) [Sinorhizobium meliloti]|nr:hypothetical protein CDO28_22495 [Sinorhizobium meliloti]
MVEGTICVEEPTKATDNVEWLRQSFAFEAGFLRLIRLWDDRAENAAAAMAGILERGGHVKRSPAGSAICRRGRGEGATRSGLIMVGTPSWFFIVWNIAVVRTHECATAGVAPKRPDMLRFEIAS